MRKSVHTRHTRHGTTTHKPQPEPTKGAGVPPNIEDLRREAFEIYHKQFYSQANPNNASKTKGSQSMGYFSDMVGKGKGTRMFLWIVNDIGETICQRLDEDGKPIDFSASSAEDLGSLETLAKAINPEAVVHVPSGYWPGQPYAYDFDIADHWSDVANVLNGPASVRRSRYIEIWKKWDHCPLMLSGSPYRRDVEPTDKAKNIDTKHTNDTDTTND
jgi:hypothetical protein